MRRIDIQLRIGCVIVDEDARPSVGTKVLHPPDDHLWDLPLSQSPDFQSRYHVAVGAFRVDRHQRQHPLPARRIEQVLADVRQRMRRRPLLPRVKVCLRQEAVLLHQVRYPLCHQRLERLAQRGNE